MQKTDEYIKSRLIWKANKHSLPTRFSLLFSDLSISVQKHLNDNIHETESGIPVLFFTKATQEWTLICTRQIVCNDNQKTFRINIADIDKIRAKPLYEYSKGYTNDTKAAKNKSEYHELLIIDKQGNIFIVHAAKGADLFSFWNILLLAKGLFK